MKIINSGKPFTFCYQSADQDTGLFVEARVYDVSSGSAVLLGSVVMTHAGNGLYGGKYISTIAASYLVIAVTYTDGTYSTLADNSPWAECYRCDDAPNNLLLFNFGAFDMDVTLSVGASIYDDTTGAPVFQALVHMPEVFAGVYFGRYSGTANHAYLLITAVYTDNTYSAISSNWTPGSEAEQLSSAANVYLIDGAAVLTGQALNATLEALC